MNTIGAPGAEGPGITDRRTAVTYKYVYEDAQILAAEFGRTVEDEDGILHPHPEHADRHTLKVMLRDGDKLPGVGARDRITVIIERDHL